MSHYGTAQEVFAAHGTVFLGEGATFVDTNLLAWVDIRNPVLDGPARSSESTLNLFNTATFENSRIKMPTGVCVSAVVPTSDRDMLILATNCGLYRFRFSKPDEVSECNPLSQIRLKAPYSYRERPNDCRVAPNGKLLVSWMGESTFREKHPFAASLWEINGDPTVQPRTVLEGLHIPNGLVFSPLKVDPTTGDYLYRMFFNDTYRPGPSGTRLATTDEYIFDWTGSTPTFHGVLIDYRAAGFPVGYPDGMARVDNLLLVPLFGGNCVAVVDSTSGLALGRIDVPANQVTSVAVEPEGTRMFITTANERFTNEAWNDAQESDPNAGSLFMFDLSVISRELKGKKPWRFFVD